MPLILDLPDSGFEQVNFDLIVPKSINRMIGRRTEKRRYGTPYWVAQYNFADLDYRGYGAADAFIRTLESRDAVFRAYDVFRPRPIEFATTPLTWSPNLVDINDPHSVDIENVAPNAQFRKGDYIGFVMSELLVSLHSIAVDVQADGEGNVTLSIDPALDTQNFSVSATPVFEKPYCLMQPEEYNATKSWSQRNPNFSAEEVFLAESEEEY